MVLEDRVSPTKRLVTMREAAERMSVSVGTMRKWVTEGRFSRVELTPGAIRLREAELDEYIAERTTSR